MSFKSWLRQKLSDDALTRVTTDAPPPNYDMTVGLPKVTNIPPMPPVEKPKKPRKPRAKKATKPKEIVTPVTPTPPTENLEKLAATAKGEPWVNVVGFDLDIDNLSSGSFDLDWNEIFVAKLIRAGYKGKSDVDIVDQWFTQICRNIIEENFEQMMADPDKRHNT